MAKKKTAEPVATLKREVLANGNIKLSSPNKIRDTRNDAIYSEVVCKPQNERFFKEVEIDA